jgi:hypothetical protein
MVKRRALYKVATRRWLRAMETAKILFEDDGYHKHYLDEIEHFIRRKKMYSPKIREDLIPLLYKAAKRKGLPMTKLVDKFIREGLNNLLAQKMPDKGGEKDVAEGAKHKAHF